MCLDCCLIKHTLHYTKMNGGMVFGMVEQIKRERSIVLAGNNNNYNHIQFNFNQRTLIDVSVELILNRKIINEIKLYARNRL